MPSGSVSSLLPQNAHRHTFDSDFMLKETRVFLHDVRFFFIILNEYKFSCWCLLIRPGTECPFWDAQGYTLPVASAAQDWRTFKYFYMATSSFVLLILQPEFHFFRVLESSRTVWWWLILYSDLFSSGSDRGHGTKGLMASHCEKWLSHYILMAYFCQQAVETVGREKYK